MRQVSQPFHIRHVPLEALSEHVINDDFNLLRVSLASSKEIAKALVMVVEENTRR